MVSEARREHKWYRVHRCLNWLAGIHTPTAYRWIRRFSSICFWLAAAFLALIPFCDPRDQQVDEWWQGAFNTIHTYRFTIAASIITVQLILQAAIWLAGKLQSLDVTKLENVLNHAVARHFTEQDRSKYDYRATLFKVRSCWFCGSWLGIVARSGTLYPQRTTVFCIDPNQERYNTGIAGECWRREGQTIIKELPDVQAGSPSQDTVNEFKAAGYLADCEYRPLSVKSTVFYATGIRVAGKVWGALVLDSTDPSQLPKERQQKTQGRDLEFVALALEQLVS